MANFQTYQAAIAPPWLQDTYGARYLAALGSVKDVHAQRAREAVFSRFPSYAATDALALIGQERSMPQGLAETTSAWRARLIKAWQYWQLGGTAWGILAQLQLQGYTPYIACANGYIYGPGATLTAPPALQKVTPGWQWSGVPPRSGFFSAFGLIFDPLPSSWTSIVNPPTSLSHPSLAEIQFICSIVRTWKPAFATFAGILAVQSYPLWGWPPSAKWGTGGRLWGGGASTLFTC